MSIYSTKNNMCQVLQFDTYFLNGVISLSQARNNTSYCQEVLPTSHVFKYLEKINSFINDLMDQSLATILKFLHCETPNEWIEQAKKPENLKVILLDHLICELKAAQSAMYLIRQYAVDRQSGDALLAWLMPYEDFAYRQQGNWQNLVKANNFTKGMIPRSGTEYGQELIDKMVLLIKEELHHFYQVLEMMEVFGIFYENISSGRYAKGLLKHVQTHEPETLVDKLICSAYIEARSCERFAKLAPHVDSRLCDFYLSLLRSEARHYQDYLALATQIASHNISDRVQYFGIIEAQLILTPDNDFKFHSGIPK